MFKPIFLILILVLLNSCRSIVPDRNPSSTDFERSCSAVVQSFFSKDIGFKDKVLNKLPFTKKAVADPSSSTYEEVYAWISNSQIDSIKTKKSFEDFKSLPFTDDQFKKILKLYPKFPKTKKKADELYLYLSYANSFHAKKKELVLDDLTYVRRGKVKESKYYSKFKDSRSKFKRYEQTQSRMIMKKLHKETDLSKDQIIKRAKKEALQNRKNFEQLSYACSAKVKTDDNSLASKRFQKFALVVTPISTASMFTFANREELKEALDDDDNEKLQDWSMKLGYEIVLMSALNMVLSKIMSEPTGSYFSKVWKGAASDISLISADSLIYDQVFAASDDDLRIRYERIKESEDYKKMLEDLQEIVSKETIYQSYKRSIFNSVKSFIGVENDKDSPIDLSKLTKEELDDPKVQDAILKALTVEMYEEDRGEKDDALSSLIHTGTKGEDRLFFFMEVAPIYHSINVGVGALIYSTICMGKNNPAKGFRNAALIYATWSFSYNLFEFSARQHQIGQ